MTACTDQVNVNSKKKKLLSHRILDTVSYEVCTQYAAVVNFFSNTR